jgi:hypothetical protein
MLHEFQKQNDSKSDLIVCNGQRIKFFYQNAVPIPAQYIINMNKLQFCSTQKFFFVLVEVDRVGTVLY